MNKNKSKKNSKIVNKKEIQKIIKIEKIANINIQNICPYHPKSDRYLSIVNPCYRQENDKIVV